MTVPTPTIDTLPAPDRKKMTALLAERAMFGLVFSYKKLLKLAGSVDKIKECISAMDEDEAKEERHLINDGISQIMAENLQPNDKGNISLRGPDQFGVVRDLIFMQSKGTPSISRTRLMELAPKYKISTDVAAKWIEEATTRTPFTTVQCRKVKGKEE